MSEVKRFSEGPIGKGIYADPEGELCGFHHLERVTAERDALQVLLTAADERADEARAFVIRLIECAGGQPSIATGYLSDILDALKPAEGGGDE